MRTCLDCGYSGKKFVAGGCPACGSLRIKQPEKAEQSSSRKPIQLLLLVSLWAYLFYLIWTKLSGA